MAVRDIPDDGEKSNGIPLFPANASKYNHYFRPFPYTAIDVYRVLTVFEVSDPALQHAIKKLLVAGGRGHKDISKDVQEAMDSLQRWQEMRLEEK